MIYFQVKSTDDFGSELENLRQPHESEALEFKNPEKSEKIELEDDENEGKSDVSFLLNCYFEGWKAFLTLDLQTKAP